MLNTFVVYVEDKPGVLARVASLFRRRAFNIDSLTVGCTEKAGVSRIMDLVEVFRAKVVDVSPDSMMIEITGTEDKIDGLLHVLEGYGVLEMVRTGRVAMRRGAKAANGASAGADSVDAAPAPGTISYSV